MNLATTQWIGQRTGVAGAEGAAPMHDDERFSTPELAMMVVGVLVCVAGVVAIVAVAIHLVVKHW